MEGLEYNVSNLLRRDIGTNAGYTVEISKPAGFDDLEASRILGWVRLTRTNFGILAKADLTALVALECDRCLDVFGAEVHVAFAEEYLPVVDVSTGRPVQSERTDETFFISPNHIVDLTEAARQHILLAVPMHRICRDGCRGLCATCGVNRNRQECGCHEVFESPLSALGALWAESRNGS